MRDFYHHLKTLPRLTNLESIFVSAYEMWLNNEHDVDRDDVQAAYQEAYDEPRDALCEADAHAYGPAPYQEPKCA